jgi:ATP-dependent DNA helicase RecG
MIRFIAPEDRVVYGPSKNGTVAFTEKERQILELLSEDPAYTYQELANRLNIGRKAVFGRIKKLKDKGTLQRVGSDKSGYWKINM